MDTLLLRKSDVEQLIELDHVQQAVESGYVSFYKGQVVQPDFMNIVTPGTHTGFDFKGGLDLAGGHVSMKSSSGGYPDNPSLGLPTGMNMVYLYDAKTSALQCIMDGTFITGCRTAAAGAISVKYLAREDASTIAMLGAGNQARRQLRAILRVRNIQKVYVWSFSKESAENYIQDMTKEMNLEFILCETPQEAVENADIIVTTTIGRRGVVVKSDWVKPGTHIAAIGADMPDKQELDSALFSRAKAVCDSTALCLKNGETHHAVSDGVIKETDIYAEIGAIIAGEKAGRENKEEITIFDTVGMAIQDNVMAAAIYRDALEQGLGYKFDFLV